MTAWLDYRTVHCTAQLTRHVQVQTRASTDTYHCVDAAHFLALPILLLRWMQVRCDDDDDGLDCDCDRINDGGGHMYVRVMTTT
eukprot:m.328825 g.328825  ORF g.328825 m.328825 type:complete len:84 (+) comp16034_c3_seq19:458-709(+)